MNINSILFNTDSYKVGMWLQYPKNTTGVFSYIESRGGEYDENVFIGLQYFIKEYLEKPFTLQDIEDAEKFYAVHGEPFNKEGWVRMFEAYGGYLPIRIRAVKEGSVVPVSNALVTIENIDPEFYWATTWVETAILRAVWYGTTVASQSRSIKKVILAALEETGDPAGINFKLHDFGARGVSSNESAGIGGMAHLANFMGTDTVMAIMFAMKYYGADICGFSIPAAEHSTITSWLRENEIEAYRNMITQFGGKYPLIAVVSDSYHVYEAAKLWGTVLLDTVRESGSMLVVRPDSGDPATVVAGLRYVEVDNLDDYTLLDVTASVVFNKADGKFYNVESYDTGWTTKFNIKEISEAEVKGIIGVLADNFGYTMNDKGYKVLNGVRVIQGDGINEESIKEILANMKRGGWSADNVAFGMGGALLQHVNRDTNKFAMKCSAAKVDGEWRDVYKDPVTDTGKRSKKGRLTLVKGPAGYETIRVEELESKIATGNVEALETVWVAGKLYRDQKFDEIRELAAI